MCKEELQKLKKDYIYSHFKLLDNNLFRLDGRSNNWKKIKESSEKYTQIGIYINNKKVTTYYHCVVHLLRYGEFPSYIRSNKTKWEIDEILLKKTRKELFWENGNIYRVYAYCIKKVVPYKSSDGYWRIGFNRRSFRLAAIKWAMFYNKTIPNGYVIDHIDGNKLNDDISNLRLATYRENAQNRKKHREGKLVGCSYQKKNGKWLSTIRVDQYRVFLGLYKDEEEGHEIYNIACNNLGKFKNPKQFRNLVNGLYNKRCNNAMV